ncbi:MAG: hypothetical protein E6G41_02415 [Actinobacteria bacterium]|nr:MAG: hypothetical protein E6G41_02415 [Actinomycetota bacterium]
MTGIDLTRTRELGQLVEDSWQLFKGNLGLFVTIALVVVIPADLILLGVGLGELWEDYQSDNVGHSAFQALVHLLVVQPLVTAACIAAVMALGSGEQPSAGWSVARGFERWGAVVGAVVLGGLAVLAGLIAFIIPGLWLAVALYFASQAVVAEGRSPMDALRRSRELVRGQWWRVFGIGVFFAVVIGVLTGIVTAGGNAIADSTDRQVFSLLGTMFADVFAIGFTAVASTLVFFDLRVRGEGVPPPPRWAPAGWEAPTPRQAPDPERTS